MVLSDIMLAHLNELLYSINLAYKANLEDEGIESILLRDVMTSLYEVIKNPKEELIKQKTEKLINTTKTIIQVKEEAIDELDKILITDNDDIKFLFREGTAFARMQMCKSLCDVIVNQRYFLQYYTLEEFEAVEIKNFLKALSIFLDSYSRLD
jgi:hypothetical protein